MPEVFKSFEDVTEYLRKFRRSLQDEHFARVADFPTYLNIYTKAAENTNLANNAVLDTRIGAGYGLLIVRELVDGITGTFKIDNQTIAIGSADATFTTDKDTAASYNVYWETDSYKVQNKVGNGKNVRVLYYGD